MKTENTLEFFTYLRAREEVVRVFKAGLSRMTKSYELRDCVYNSEVHIHHSKNIAW